MNPADEGRHAPRSGPRWEESWYFDFAAPDARLAGYVRLALRPSEGRAWFWAALAGADRGPLVVRDHDVEAPTGRSLEVRASGLWTDFICETPLEHWTVGVEAFGVSLEDPAEVYRGERGDRVAVGLDLEWEALSAVVEPPGSNRYEQSCSVHGEILEGSTRTGFEGVGWRTHAWGRRDWWADDWSWAGCHLDDGSASAVADEDDEAELSVAVGPGGLVEGVEMAAAGRRLTAVPVAHAPVFLPAPGGGAPRWLARSLCRFADPSGTTGLGWAEALTSPTP